MNPEFLRGLIFNASLLFAISIVYNTFFSIERQKNRIFSIFIGIILGVVGIILIMNTVVLGSGLIFDTRSILVSVVGLFFGVIPTVIASSIIIIYRVSLGGHGVLMGSLVTLITSMIGLLWNRFRLNEILKKQKYIWLEFYIFGLLTHLGMLLCVFVLPKFLILDTLKQISGPVILIYPIGSLLLCTVIYTGLKHNQIRLALIESEEYFRTLFEQAPIGISVGNNEGTIFYANSMLEMILCRSKDEIKKLGWEGYTHPDDLPNALQYFQRFISGEINGYTMIKRYVKPDSSYAWVKVTVAPLAIANQTDKRYLCMVEDITAIKSAEEQMRESERSKIVLLSNIPGMSYRCNYDKDWTMQFVSDGCYNLTGYKPESLLNNKELSFNSIISPKYRDYLWYKWEEVIASDLKFKEEYEIITASGEHKWVLEQAQGVFNKQGEVVAIEGLIIDITERKMREDEIQHLSYYDALTNVYNRRYFEQEKKHLDSMQFLPLSIIIGDINGLKMLNDALGHSEGDKLITETAGLLLSCCRENDVLARTGGDEFSILLPNTTRDEAFELQKNIHLKIDTHNRNTSNELYKINICLGFETKTVIDEDLDHVVKSAENYMYKRKLFEHKSSHSALISSIMATMLAKSQETEEHAERIASLSRKVGLKLGLSEAKLDELVLLSMLHDIGKVGIDDRILNKPDKLTEEEWTIMKTHPEIGYRIAMSTPELASIADYILSHHERWDGNGYPQSLQGEEIPLLSRILTIVDSYDAMTQDRIYHKAMSKEDAIEEIKNNSGTQFDPVITHIFIDILNEKN